MENNNKIVQIIVVTGEWRFDNRRWLFFVDSRSGSRLITANVDMRYVDFVSLINDEYGFNENEEIIELSYMLAKRMLRALPQDTPSVIIANDRQFHAYLQQCEESSLRLCVSVKKPPKIPTEDVNPRLYEEVLMASVIHNERSQIGENEKDSDDNELDDDEGPIFDCCDDEDGVTSDDEDYTVYGMSEVLVNDQPKLPLKKRGSQMHFLVHEDLERLETPAITIAVGQRYETKKALKSKLKMLSVINNFDYDVVKSTTNLYVVKCWVNGCSWRVRASPVGDSSQFYIRKYVEDHTCSVTERSTRSRKATPDILGELYKDFIGGVGPTILPEHLADALRIRFRIKVDYWKAHRALAHARSLITGLPESGYEDLPTYLFQIRHANPGTYTRLEVDEDRKFKYVFIAFGASIFGFQYMRKIIVVDGTFLKGKYKGTLLIATAQDGNFQIFPIAFGIVDTENDKSWEWFFTQLAKVIPDDRGLVIISDRHKSISNAIQVVYPLCARGICTYHLYKNILVRFKGGEIFGVVKKAANSFRIDEFEEYFQEIHNRNPSLYEYLIRADVKQWTRVHFPGHRYNITTTNIAEYLNNVIRKKRDLPIVILIDEIRLILTRWFADRRKDATKTNTVLTQAVEKLLQARVRVAKDIHVQEIDEDSYEVTNRAFVNVVNITLRKCTCRMYDLEKIPCVHAIAAIERNKLSIINHSHPYYRTSYLVHGYSRTVIPRDRALIVPVNVVEQLCLPPDVRQPPGRPKKGRFKSAIEMAMGKKRCVKITYVLDVVMSATTQRRAKSSSIFSLNM